MHLNLFIHYIVHFILSLSFLLYFIFSIVTLSLGTKHIPYYYYYYYYCLIFILAIIHDLSDKLTNF